MAHVHHRNAVKDHLQRVLAQSPPNRNQERKTIVNSPSKSPKSVLINDTQLIREKEDDNKLKEATPIPPSQFYSNKFQLLDSSVSSSMHTAARRWFGIREAIFSGKQLPADWNKLLQLNNDPWRVFLKQADAIRYQEAERSELHVFSFEDDSTKETGGRKFLVTSYKEFWRRYIKMDPNERHYYELIKENTPCRLYFDIEYIIAYNRDANGDQLFQLFKDLLAEYVKRTLNVECEDMVDLCSSNELKFSRHLIVIFSSAVFKTNIDVGIFVLNFLSDLRGAILNKSHLRQSEVEKLIVKDQHGKSRFFVDDGVYTRNRNFRLYLSSKLGKSTPMRIASAYRPPDPPDSLLFFRRTLICAVGELTSSTRVLTCQLLPGPHGAGFDLSLLGNATFATSFQTQSEERSPYPAVDAFMLSKMSRGGVKGYIRSSVYFPEGKKILYFVGGNRFCENIGRCHKSNHVLYIADLNFGLYVQRCTDSDCRLQNFQSDPQPLPIDINPFAQALQSNNEKPQPELEEIPDDVLFASLQDSPVCETAQTEEPPVFRTASGKVMAVPESKLVQMQQWLEADNPVSFSSSSTAGSPFKRQQYTSSVASRTDASNRKHSIDAEDEDDQELMKFLKQMDGMDDCHDTTRLNHSNNNNHQNLDLDTSQADDDDVVLASLIVEPSSKHSYSIQQQTEDHSLKRPRLSSNGDLDELLAEDELDKLMAHIDESSFPKDS